MSINFDEIHLTEFSPTKPFIVIYLLPNQSCDPSYLFQLMVQLIA